MVENKVKERRKELEVTQAWLAEESGVSQATISEIESGAEPKVVTALAIARALGTTVE